MAIRIILLLYNSDANTSRMDRTMTPAKIAGFGHPAQAIKTEDRHGSIAKAGRCVGLQSRRNEAPDFIFRNTTLSVT